jgi:hypothetical protein
MSIVLEEGDAFSNLFWGMSKGEKRLIHVPKGMFARYPYDVMIQAHATRIVRSDIALAQPRKR